MQDVPLPKRYHTDSKPGLFGRIAENAIYFEVCSIMALAIGAFAYSTWILIDYFTAVDGISGPNLFVQMCATYGLIVVCFTYLDWRSKNY